MTEAPALLALLAVAAGAAGLLNAIAGGGSFLTFPALVFAGVPPIAANATSAVAVCPGYLGSALGFRSELREMAGPRLRTEVVIAAAGGISGALLLLWTPARLFSQIVPWLLLFATALFALGPRLSATLATGAGSPHPGWRSPGLYLVALYGGYFNGGLGILLMALYSLAGERNLQKVNALKNLHSLVLSLVSVAAFAWAGAIAWREGVWMMVWATLGGYLGARLARRLPTVWVRRLVIVTGLLMSAVFFVRLN